MSSRGTKMLWALGAAMVLVIGLAVFINRSPAPVLVDPAKPAVLEKETKQTLPRLPRGARHLAETPVEPAVLGASPEEQARMQRMSDNLLKPQLELDAVAAAKKRAEWVDRFHREQDPLLREEIITEMVQLDDPLTLKTMMDLLPDEEHPGVRDQIVLILGYLRSAVPEIARLSPVMAEAYQHSANPEEKARILDVMSNLPTSESMQFMQTAFSASSASADERFHAAEGLFKLASLYEVDPELVRQVTGRLKQDAQTAPNPQDRLMAARALAAPGQDNKAFLRQLLATETDPEVQQFLTLASQQFPTR